MGVVRSGHFWQLGSIASLTTGTTGGEILLTLWPKHGLRSNLRVPNFKKISWGEHDPLAYYQSKIAGSGHAQIRLSFIIAVGS